MLKRLSATFNSSSSDLHNSVAYALPSPQSELLTIQSAGANGYFVPSSAPSSPSMLPLDTAFAAHRQSGIERSTLNKSLKCLELLLLALDEYRQVTDLLYKAQKKIAKASKELASCLKEGSFKETLREDATLNTLNASTTIFDNLSDVDLKFCKIAQKNYETCNEICTKGFRKIGREEREFDEVMSDLDFKLKKCSGTYDKRMRTTSNPSSNAYEHNKHIQLLNTLNADMSARKHGHSVTMKTRRDQIVTAVVRCVSDLADSEFRRSCEAVRKAGSNIPMLLAWSNLIHTESTVIPQMPTDLPDLDPEMSKFRQLSALDDEASTLKKSGSVQNLCFASTSIAPYSSTDKPILQAPVKSDSISNHHSELRRLSTSDSSGDLLRGHKNGASSMTSPDSSQSDVSGLAAGTRFSSLQAYSGKATSDTSRGTSPINFVEEELEEEEASSMSTLHSSNPSALPRTANTGSNDSGAQLVNKVQQMRDRYMIARDRTITHHASFAHTRNIFLDLLADTFEAEDRRERVELPRAAYTAILTL